MGDSDESVVAERRDADDRRGAALITLLNKCPQKDSREVNECIR